jgi:pimeloyl-ACP methyl ester carboxylesterase
MHDRAGLGWSYEPPAPRSASDLAKDLQAVARHAAIAPPYVLVGHSIGGFNVRAFAHRFPAEVAGIVLVDSSHPDQWTRFGRIIPRQALGEPAALRRFRQKPDPASTPERIDFLASADETRAIRTLGDKPLVVLSRSPDALSVPGLPAGIAERLEQVWSELQRDLLNLSTRSSQVIATHAGHNIPLDEPQLVAETILKLVRDIRMPRPVMH